MIRKEKKRRKSNVVDYEFGMIMNPHVVTDVVEELSHDRLRDPVTQQVYAQDDIPDLFLGRGYTGHEHLPWFGGDAYEHGAVYYNDVTNYFMKWIGDTFYKVHGEINWNNTSWNTYPFIGICYPDAGNGG